VVLVTCMPLWPAVSGKGDCLHHRLVFGEPGGLGKEETI
jgi:hypothetical protein